MATDYNERTGSWEDDADREEADALTPAEDLLLALSHSYPNLHAIVTGYPSHGQTAATREAAQVEACSLLRDALDARLERPVYAAAVEWHRAHAQRHPNLTETIGAYCRLEDAVVGAAEEVRKRCRTE